MDDLEFYKQMYRKERDEAERLRKALAEWSEHNGCGCPCCYQAMNYAGEILNQQIRNET
jgi:hypothetical protein